MLIILNAILYIITLFGLDSSDLLNRLQLDRHLPPAAECNFLSEWQWRGLYLTVA